MYHSKELAFTFIIMLVFLPVLYIIFGSLHTIGLFSCYRIIIILESESPKPSIFKTTK